VKLHTEQDGRLRRIRLASPVTRNFLDEQMCADLLQELRASAADEATGAILIDAEGPVFCSGVEEAAGGELFGIGRRISKPIVAAVKGVALAGGIVLVANAHVVVAAQGTSFGLTDIREGKWSEPTFRAVATAVGERRALELCLTGRIFTTPDALAWGLVHMVAPAFELEDRATEIARLLANASPDAVRAALRCP
jgi:enoyl-CoA hydratase/carnithine racemase